MAGHERKIAVYDPIAPRYDSAMERKPAEIREGMVVTSCALDEAIHGRLAIATVEERAAITELIRQAVGEWLERRDQKRRRR